MAELYADKSEGVCSCPIGSHYGPFPNEHLTVRLCGKGFKIWFSIIIW